MVDHVDYTYATMLSHRFDRWKVASNSPLKINFRCPLCGDSQKSRQKARGWLLERGREGKISYYCHNCFASHSLYDFLSIVDPMMLRDYVTERFKDKIAAKPVDDDDEQTPAEIAAEDAKFKKAPPDFSKIRRKTTTKPVDKDEPVFINDYSLGLVNVDTLPPDHNVKQYLESRKIPREKWSRLLYAKKYKEWVVKHKKDAFDRENLKYDEPRLVIPFYDENGKMFGATGRMMRDGKGIRYLTMMFEEKTKIFGLDKLDRTRKHYLFEGALDSLFIDNSVAMAGADIDLKSNFDPEKCVVVYDNEPRNREVHGKMEKAIRDGFQICIWPSWVGPKDVNNMVLSGINNVQEIIDQHTYRGLMATMEFTKWKKV